MTGNRARELTESWTTSPGSIWRARRTLIAPSAAVASYSAREK
jgi:hypothetical protein